ncbi:MAG: aldehyde dehydrogenase family protein, partial [Bacilli bacterium]|nr:aldehyde dehydrogenase family protein [Bacilli bacterium]
MDYIDNLRSYFYSGATLDYKFRIDALKKLKHSLFVNKEKLAEAFMQDLNKCEFDFISCEFSMVIGEINYFLKHLKKLMAPKKVSTSI